MAFVSNSISKAHTNSTLPSYFSIGYLFSPAKGPFIETVILASLTLSSHKHLHSYYGC